MQSHKVKIVSYEYECGDGCCHDYWDEVEVDGELLQNTDESYRPALQFRNDDDILIAVAKKLGIALHIERVEAF